MEVGWAVVGCGDIAHKRVTPAIKSQAQSRLVAFHSRNRDRAEMFASEHEADYGSQDLDRILGDDRIAVVYVASEVDRHCETAVTALSAGKHVLVEKPMASNVGECRTMVESADTAGAHLSVAYYARFLEKSRVMKRVIQEGRLGKVVRAVVRNVSYYNPDPEDPKFWRVTGRGAGNCLADVGSHRLDLLCYWLGRPTETVGLMDRLEMAYAACDTETVLARFESGAHVLAMANSNVPHPGRFPTSMEVYGTEGSLLTDPWSAEPVSIVGVDDEPVAISVPDNAHFPMIDDFASAISQGRQPEFDGTDGMWATAIIDGAYESSETGRAVTIAEA